MFSTEAASPGQYRFITGTPKFPGRTFYRMVLDEFKDISHLALAMLCVRSEKIRDDLARFFLSFLKQREFWTSYLSGEPLTESPDGDIRFDVSPTAGLVLDLAEPTLYLRHAGSERPAQLGWDDEAHWHPHVLRWAELDAICRAVAINDPSLPHPSVPLLLLNRFAPVTVGDDAEAIFETLEQAWRGLDLFSDDEVAEFSRRYDYRAAGFVWRPDVECGWLIHQDDTLRQGDEYLHHADLYTLRLTRIPDFPFHEFRKRGDVGDLAL